MQIFVEAGFVSFISLAVFVGALVAAARRGARLEGFAAAIVAVGALGAGSAQRLVAAAAELAPTLAEKVAMLSVGTREAQANLIVAGTLALVLLGVSALQRLANDAR